MRVQTSMRFILILLASLLLAGCTDYQEVLHNRYDYSLLRPHEILTGDKFIVINIDVDKNDFDEMYDNFRKEIDVYGTFTVYRNGEVVFQEEHTRFRIKGAASKTYELKSLGIRFENPVSNANRNLLNPENVLPFHNLDVIESLRLRNSGNDFSEEGNASMIKDISYTRLIVEAGLDIDVMYHEQAVVFLNEEFHGILNLRSESNARGVGHLYRTNPELTTVAKVIKGKEAYVVVQNGDHQRVDNLLYAVENKNTSYLKTQIDLSNFIDYVIFSTFIANTDWPDNNVKFFANRDSKFRFFIFDLDKSNMTHHAYEPLQMMDRALKNPVTDIFYLLYEDEDFRLAFEQRYVQLLEDGLLAPHIFKDITTKHYKNIEAHMPYHIFKYGHPPTVAEWYRNIELLNTYYEKRYHFIKNLMLK